MIERRLARRRFTDFHPGDAPPLYPYELERRHNRRRAGDRSGAPNTAALFPHQRRRSRVLFSGVWKCAHCDRELRRARNLSGEGRRHFIAENSSPATRPQCDCGASYAMLEWFFQAGIE